MNRRAALSMLSSGILILFAGCSGSNTRTDPANDGDPGTSPVAELDLKAISDIEIAKRVTYRIDLEHRSSERELAGATIRNGSKTVSAANPPVPKNRPFIYNGSVYELSYEVVDTEPATTFRLTLSVAETTDQDADSIRYRNLPTADKAVLERFGWDDGGPFEAGGVEVIYTNDEIADSVLVPSSNYSIIKWSNGTTARVSVEESSGTNQRTYEYTAQQVHASAAEFGQSVRAEHAFGLTDLSEEQASIVSTAIERDDGYQVDDGEPPEAFSRLVDRFPPEREITPVYEDDESDSSVSGSYIVRYDDEIYWTELFVSQTN